MAAKTLGFVQLSGLRRLLLGGLASAAVAYAFWPESKPPPAAPREEVVFWHMWTAEWKGVIDKIVARYNASQTRYRVIALSVPAGDASAKFLLSAVGDHSPDLMAQWLPVVPNWADNGLVRPLDDLLTPEERRRYREEVYPIVRRMGTYKGRLYGICTGIGMGGLFVSAAHLRAAGYDPDRPAKTLEELDAQADRLTRLDKGGGLRRIGFLPDGLRQYAEAFGGGFYDWDRGRVTIDTPANRRTLEYIVSRRKKLGYDNVARFEAGRAGADDAGGWRFITGDHSIAYDGPWRVEQMKKFAPNFDYRTAPFPPVAAGGRVGTGIANGNFILIPTAAKHVAGAMDFARFWSGLDNPERAAEFYTWGGWLPLSPAITNAPAYQAYLRKYPRFKTFVDLMPSPNLRTNPPVAYQQFLMDTIDRAEESAVRGRVTPAQALREAERALKRELQRRKELGYQD